MKTMLAAVAIAAAFAGNSAAASAIPARAETPPAAGSIFADLTALGYDLGKFRPDYAGRFPYR